MDMEWVALDCTLPTAERPLRIAELDELFARSLRRVERPGPLHLRLTLAAGADVAAAARDLTARESACCSFFAFDIDEGDGGSTVDVRVPPGREPILDALAELAGAQSPA
jgi:hypothetical protein